MTIREIVPSDLQAIAEVCAVAFMDEECLFPSLHFHPSWPTNLTNPVYGGLMHPYRREYPEDFVSFFFYKFGKHWFDNTRMLLVSVDDDSGTIVGFSDWNRQGKKLLPPREESDPRGLPFSLFQASNVKSAKG